MNSFVPAVLLPAGQDACAFYREFIPHLSLPGSMFLLRLGAFDVNEISQYKVALVQRLMSSDNLKTMRDIKAIGLKIVYDLDDDVASLPSFNPMQKIFNLDQVQSGFRKCAEEAHVLTVSTRGLSKAVKHLFNLDKEIYIVPNAIDFNLFKAKELKRTDGKVVIGWGGSNTHNEDLADFISALPDVLNACPKGQMQFVGGAPPFKHPQVSYRPWIPIGEYANRLASWGWDIAVAPLANYRFNRSKSNIKALEAAALKLPCLMSDVQPYAEFCELGNSDLKWLLCSFKSQWKNKLTELINDEAKRKHLGQLMYDVAYKFFNSASIAENWNYVFKKALEC